jgi:hypothetical protein
VPLPELNGTNSTIVFFFCLQPPEVPEFGPDCVGNRRQVVGSSVGAGIRRDLANCRLQPLGLNRSD